MKRLLILGSLDEFTALVQMARARGYYTIVCDGYPQGPAKQAADQSYDVDVRDISAIVRICQSEQVDHIITSFSDLLLECMVQIAQAAGLPCYLLPEQLPYYRDKYVMKQTLRRLGIGTPRFACLEKDFPDEALADFQFPVVTKPLDKYGSRGLFVIHSLGELREVFDEVCASSEEKRILVEEYHTGYEFNMMTWVHRGEVHVISIADREKTPIPTRDIPVSSRNVYPSCLLPQVLPEASQILKTYIKTTGQQEGALSMQFFWRPGEPIQVCEIAARFFGYEHELVEISGGLSIEKLLLDSVYDLPALENTLAAHSPALPQVSATLYFHGREKVIACQDKARSLMVLPGVLPEGTRLFYQEGEPVIWHGPNPYVARFYITGSSRQQVDELTDQIFREISITDADGQEILYRNKRTDYESAFSSR
ncbi:MAG TPA: ATP-grasp domain-containing protein [Candidatus Blautia gallistercoris]|uniref:ATP-grasp domain-containing protein n=1 Tax=Candidatus Blautia gallistercoris TaxID=2838490 RepID=A0A9D1WJ69_9FIRM|nr:ATP-grasp domain-containing protein [Candidatus Blautia gallistercoris]